MSATETVHQLSETAAPAKSRLIGIEMRNTVDGNGIHNNALMYLQEEACGKLKCLCVTCYEFIFGLSAVLTRRTICPTNTVTLARP
jgi:hypothetical protein